MINLDHVLCPLRVRKDEKKKNKKRKDEKKKNN